MPTFKIRPATHADAEMLGHIGVATFVESYTDEIEGTAMMAHCSNQHSASAYKTYLTARRTGCWLAEHPRTGAPIGYALNCTPDLPIDLDETDIELKRIYVLSKYHGQGIAAALLEEAVAHAKTIGAKRILLGTYKDNHRALAFYAKHGFKLIGTRKFNIGGRLYDDVILAKPIS
jgi:ribosomal protein S18 acetylase RimI-like enzyme